MTLLGAVQPLTAQDRWEELDRNFLALRAKLKELTPENADVAVERAVSSQFIIDRLDDLFRHFGRAIHDLEWLHKGWRWEASLTLNFHRDQRLAWINGARAFLAVCPGGNAMGRERMVLGVADVDSVVRGVQSFFFCSQTGESWNRFFLGWIYCLHCGLYLQFLCPDQHDRISTFVPGLRCVSHSRCDCVFGIQNIRSSAWPIALSSWRLHGP